MKRDIHLTDDQDAALLAAAKAAGISVNEFAVTALRNLASRYGVEIPASPPRRAKAYINAHAPKKTGRPRKPASHPMTRHVPAGNWQAVCPGCLREFRTDLLSTVYCSELCEKRMQSQRNYQRRKARR